MRISDWSSDVCSSDLAPPLPGWVCWILATFQMPPSYSRMLPGRMSTPLIFMRLAFVRDCAGAMPAGVARALSSAADARQGGWFCRAGRASRGGMSRSALLSSAAFALAAIQPFSAQAGTLETMPKGHYQCALPGDAAGEAWHPVEGADFRIVNGSSYKGPEDRKSTRLNSSH